MADLAKIGRILQLTGGVISPEQRQRNALMLQAEQEQQQAEKIAQLEAKRAAREFIQSNLARLPQGDPRRSRFQENFDRLNNEIAQLGGEALPEPVSQVDATQITPDRAETINQRLDQLVTRLPENVQPYLSSEAFADPVKRRNEIFKVAGALQKPQNRDRQIRQLITPDGEATTILDDKQGNFFDMSGNPIEIPEGARVVNSAQLQGSAEDLGLPEGEAQKLRDAEVGTRQLIATVGDAVERLNETPDINTFTARAAGLVNDLQAEARALANGLGVEFDENQLDPSSNADTFDELGIENQRIRSLITALAFSAAAASGQTGRAVSDTDIKRFIQETGANASDPRAFAASLQDLANRSARNFKINFETRTNEPFEGNLGDVPQFSEQRSGTPVVTSQDEFNALPSGALYREEEGGQIFRKP